MTKKSELQWNPTKNFQRKLLKKRNLFYASQMRDLWELKLKLESFFSETGKVIDLERSKGEKVLEKVFQKLEFNHVLHIRIEKKSKVCVKGEGLPESSCDHSNDQRFWLTLPSLPPERCYLSTSMRPWFFIV